MNHTYKILKYLYQKNDLKYHYVGKAYRKRYRPNEEIIFEKSLELLQSGYVKLTVIFGETFKEFSNLSGNSLQATKDLYYQNRIEKFEIKITNKGENYISDNTYGITKKWIVQKRSLWITVGIALIVAIIGAVITLTFSLIGGE